MADEQNVTNQAITEQGGAQSAGGDPTTSTPAGDGKAPAPQEDEKKFSQKELDEHINRRLERERKNQPTKEELAAFRRWQDEQKSDEERHADEIKKAQDDKAAAELRAADFEAKYTALSKGVRADTVEDVIALARVKVSEDITLDKAIDEVLKKYPQFIGLGEVPKPKITTGVPSTGGANNMSGVEKRFYEKNPQLLKQT